MFTNVNESEVWPLIHDARGELSNYLHTLTIAQWSEPSICEGWRVRDIVAHLIIEYRYPFGQIARGYIRSGFQTNKFIKDTARQFGNMPTEILLQHFDELIKDRQRPRSVPILNMLVDLLVHEQDIRQTLCQPKPMPIEPLKLLLTHWRINRFNLGEKLTGLPRRTKNLKFTATDLGFQIGAGKSIEGSAQDILLVLTGRRHSLNSVHGDGVPVLKDRL